MKANQSVSPVIFLVPIATRRVTKLGSSGAKVIIASSYKEELSASMKKKQDNCSEGEKGTKL
jgi:hypothetical protein